MLFAVHMTNAQLHVVRNHFLCKDKEEMDDGEEVVEVEVQQMMMIAFEEVIQLLIFKMVLGDYKQQKWLQREQKLVTIKVEKRLPNLKQAQDFVCQLVTVKKKI